MGRSKVGGSDIGSGLVGLERLVGGSLALIANSELSKVAVVVALPARRTGVSKYSGRVGKKEISHLVVKDLGLAALSRGDQVAVQALQDVLADLGEFGLDLLTVLLDKSDLSLIALGLFLLLDRGDDSPGRATGTNDVLVGNGQQISLLNGELLVCRGNGLHVLDHLCRGWLVWNIAALQSRWLTLIALGLFGQLGQIHGVFVTHCDVKSDVCHC